MASILTPLYRSVRARLAEVIASESAITVERNVYRVLGGDTGGVEFYHCPSDPHSHLLLQGCQHLLKHYDVKIHVKIVPEPKLAGLAAYGGGEEEQFQWRVADCVEVAGIYPDMLVLPAHILPATQIDETLRKAAMKALLSLFQHESCSVEMLETAVEVGAIVLGDGGLTALDGVVGLGESWREMSEVELQERLQENLDALTKGGHYLSGTSCSWRVEL